MAASPLCMACQLAPPALACLLHGRGHHYAARRMSSCLSDLSWAHSWKVNPGSTCKSLVQTLVILSAAAARSGEPQRLLIAPTVQHLLHRGHFRENIVSMGAHNVR